MKTQIFDNRRRNWTRYTKKDKTRVINWNNKEYPILMNKEGNTLKEVSQNYYEYFICNDIKYIIKL